MSQPNPEIPMLNVQIDGTWHQFPKGTRVIEACRQAGKFIPHYCYHPRLSSPGNCRMCMVEMGMPRMTPDRKPVLGQDGRPEIAWMPRAQISCAQDVAEGMGVRTDSPMVRECRTGVMEFLLINHPLDCPICDQAGECRLQEFSVEFGRGGSRFLDEKVKKPKNVTLGPRVKLDDERCILCSRCIRFMKEVAKDDVLGFVDRGSFSTLTCHPDRMLDSNYSLNTVDLCPVGALTSSDFRFKMRVWFLKETRSICTGCATGCNTVIGSREHKLYRQTPRENDAVNQSWMCDAGRLDFQGIDSLARLAAPRMTVDGDRTTADWTEAIAAASEKLRGVAAGQLALIASARMTNEELFLASKLVRSLGVASEHVDVLPRTGEADGILLSADRNPNTRGALLAGIASSVPGSNLPAIAEGIRSGRIKGLLVLRENPADCGIPETDLAKLEAFVAVEMLDFSPLKHAHVVLPSAAFAEKRGSMVNGKGRLQRLNRAVNPPGLARDDWEILRDLLAAVDPATPAFPQIEDVFHDMAATIPAFAGLSLGKIGDAGLALNQP